MCTGPDGIGDTPYLVNTNSMDRYPLMVPQIDVAVLNLVLSRSFAYAGVPAMPIVANVTVANYGMIAETLTVTILLDGGLIGTQAVSVAAGASMVATFELSTDFVDRGDWVLSAQASPVPGEANLIDNMVTGSSFEVRLQGDVVPDCKVNIFDIATIAFAYDSSVGTERWNPYADLDNNGKVNILDVATAAINYDRGC